MPKKNVCFRLGISQVCCIRCSKCATWPRWSFRWNVLYSFFRPRLKPQGDSFDSECKADQRIGYYNKSTILNRNLWPGSPWVTRPTIDPTVTRLPKFSKKTAGFFASDVWWSFTFPLLLTPLNRARKSTMYVKAKHETSCHLGCPRLSNPESGSIPRTW